VAERLAPDAAVGVADAAPAALTVPGGWLDGWGYRRRIRVGGASREALADFPVLLRIGAEIVGKSAEGGRDVRFVDARGAALAFDVDTWTPSAALLWVRLPALPAGGGEATLTMYYGNPAARPRAPQDGHGVWDPRAFLGVWHLSGSPADATQSGLGAVMGTRPSPAFAPSSYVAARVGTGYDFDLSSITFGQMREVASNAAAVTLSAWVYLNTFEGGGEARAHGILSIGDPAYGGHHVISSMISGGAAGPGRFSIELQPMLCGTRCVVKVVSDPVLPLRTWTHVAVVADLAARTAIFYKDGVPVGAPRTADFKAAVFPPSVVSPVSAMGANANGCCARLSGRLDEVRLERVARGADWISALHKTMTAPDFAALGPEEARPP
jgi:hypothetical protein